MENDSKCPDDSQDEELPKYDQAKTHSCLMKEGETGGKSPALGPPFGRSGVSSRGFHLCGERWVFSWWPFISGYCVGGEGTLGGENQPLGAHRKCPVSSGKGPHSQPQGETLPRVHCSPSPLASSTRTTQALVRPRPRPPEPERAFF